MKSSAVLAAPALVLGAMALTAAPAAAAEAWSYQTELAPVNNSTATGRAVVDGVGDQATVTVEVSGVAALLQGATYPHAQHIHIGGRGVCAPPTADTDGDGVVTSAEGHPYTGTVGTALTRSGDTDPASAGAMDRFPAGGAYTYQRTLTLDAPTLTALQNGTAVLSVHGADPATLMTAAQQDVSRVAPDLPPAPDIPVACGTFAPTQMEPPWPEGPPDTGVETGASTANANGLAGTALLAALALGAVRLRRRAAGGC